MKMAKDFLEGSDAFGTSPDSFHSAIEDIPACQDFEIHSSSSESCSIFPSGFSALNLILEDDTVTALTAQESSNAAENSHHRRTMSRSFSDPSQIASTKIGGESATVKDSRHDRSSVKHLTCFWWKSKGFCRFSDEDCLYAHHDTGHYTDPPRQIVPGEPALAGRKLDRAMRNLAIIQRSSASLSTMAESRHNSRPGTPIFDFGPPASSPVLTHQQPQPEVSRLAGDNQFLKNLIEQNAKEKSVMISHIEDLQAENKGLKAENEGLRTAQQQLLVARDGLQNRIQELEAQNAGARGYNAQYGVIGVYGGRVRMNSEARYLGGLLDD